MDWIEAGNSGQVFMQHYALKYGSERPDRDLPEPELRAFRLEKDAALAGLRAAALDHLRAVHPIREAVAAAFELQDVPLAARALQVVLAVEAQHVLPLRRTLLPVDAAAHDPRAVDRKHLLLRLREALLIGGIVRDAAAANHEEVAGPALDDLELDGFRPDLVLAPHVKEDAAVARGLLARRPRRLAPLELGLQEVVLVLLLGREIAEFLAADVDGAVLDAEDLVRVVVLSLGLQPGIEAGEILAVPEVVVGGRGGAEQGERERGDQAHADLLLLY